MKNVFFDTTKRTLLKSKKRSAVTILGVIVLVAMITCVLCLASTLQSYLVEKAKDDYGNWSVAVKNLDEDAVVQAEKEGFKIAQDTAIGYGYIPESKNPLRPFIYLTEMGQGMDEVADFKILRGRNVQRAGEIVLPESFLVNGGIDYEIGDKILLNLGTRIDLKSGAELEQNNLYKAANEVFFSKKDMMFEVVGICDRIAIEPAQAPGYTAVVKDVAPLMESKTTYFSDEEYMNISFFLDKFYIPRENIKYNEQLLFASNEINIDGTSPAYYSVAFFLLILIIVTGCILMNNAFMITFVERQKQYRVLAALGATERQLRKIPFYEGILVGGIGIIIGLIAGVLGAAVVTELFGQDIVGTIVANPKGEIKFVLSPWAIVLSFLFSAVSVQLSITIPAYRAGKMKPIEERYLSEVSRKTQKALVKQKEAKGIFSTVEMKLARKNFKNNSKKYKTTMISMALCVVLLVVSSGMAMYAKDTIAKLLGTENDYDIVYTAENSREADASFVKLQLAEGVTESTVVYSGIFRTQDRNWDYSYNLMVLDDQSFEKYLKEKGVYSSKYFDKNENNGILVRNGEVTNIQKSNNRDVKVDGNFGGKTVSLNVIGELKKLPTGMYDYVNKASIVMSKTAALDILQGVDIRLLQGEAMFKSSNIKRTLDDMKVICQNSTLKEDSLADISGSRETLANMVNVIQMIAYVFIFMISLISLMNVFNTISSSVDMRRVELITYNSIGMTYKSIFKIIFYEFMMLGGKTLAYALPISIITIATVDSLIGMVLTMDFKMPIGSIVIAIMVVSAMVSVITIYAIRQFKKELFDLSSTKNNI
ncbi:MAG: ABC transporter permease [Eubacterium sp.]|nr:ABC transporter permease [Eubacterium sp.]